MKDSCVQLLGARRQRALAYADKFLRENPDPVKRSERPELEVSDAWRELLERSIQNPDRYRRRKDSPARPRRKAAIKSVVQP